MVEFSAMRKVYENLAEFSRTLGFDQEFKIRVWFTRDATGPHAQSDQRKVTEVSGTLVTNIQARGILDPMVVVILAQELLIEDYHRISAIQVSLNGLTSILYPTWP